MVGEGNEDATGLIVSCCVDFFQKDTHRERLTKDMNYANESRSVGFEPPNESTPTQARPGSAHKLHIMAERYRFGQPLHDPEDESLLAFRPRKEMALFLAAARQMKTNPELELLL